VRIGQGFDAHRFTREKPLILGGTRIPFELGLAAHSDGDVLIHALCDALFGAAGLGDIGRHFPDTSTAYKDIDSRVLLRGVVAKLLALDYRTHNADLTLVAQRPKIAAHIPSMRENLASDLAVAVDRVNIKGTTTEGMGFTGRGEGIAAFAVVLLDEPIAP